VKLAHQGAIEHLRLFLREHFGGDFRLAGVGHRVGHGGTKYSQPVRVDEAIIVDLERLIPLAPYTSRITWRRFAWC
jgi:acetate kinase